MLTAHFFPDVFFLFASSLSRNIALYISLWTCYWDNTVRFWRRHPDKQSWLRPVLHCWSCFSINIRVRPRCANTSQHSSLPLCPLSVVQSVVGGSVLGRAPALFNMPLPSHLPRPGTCYLGDSNILFYFFYFFFCWGPCCLLLPHRVSPPPPSSSSLLFSLTSTHTYTNAGARSHTHTQQGQPPSFFPSLTLPPSLSLPLPICWESLRQLRSDTAALQTKEGAARSTATYLLRCT